MGTTIQLGFANMFAAISILLVALSFSTDHWMEYYVQRDDLKQAAAVNPDLNTSMYWDPLYFSRSRGLFRTCYSGSETLFFDKSPYVEDAIDGNCLPERGYEIERRETTLNFGDEYDARIHMMRAHFAFFVLALLMLVAGCIMGAVGCWNVEGRLLRATGLVLFIGSFFVAVGMALFHGYEYLESQKIDAPEFVKNWKTLQWLTDTFTRVEYGYSYILGWIGMAISAVSAIMFLCAAYASQPDYDDDDRERPSKRRNKAHRNRAYDYMEQEQPIPMAGGYDDPKYGMGTYPSAMVPTGTYPSAAYPVAQPYSTGLDYGGYRY